MDPETRLVPLYTKDCPLSDSGTRPAHPRTSATSPPADTTRWPTQNLWTGSLVNGFAYQIQSVKTGIGTYLLKYTGTNARIIGS